MGNKISLSKSGNSAMVRFSSCQPLSVAQARYHSRSRFSIEVVEEVGESLLEKETLDDYRCSTFWRHSRHVHRSKSAVAIKNELTTKGTSVDIIETALDDFDDIISAHEAGFKFSRFFKHILFRVIRTETQQLFALSGL